MLKVKRVCGLNIPIDKINNSGFFFPFRSKMSLFIRRYGIFDFL